MVFSSALFLMVFLPIFLMVYHLVPRKLKNYVIVAFSIVFYAWGAPRFVFLLLFSTIATFYLVQRMNQIPIHKKKRPLLAITISLNLGLLLYFKYANFFVDNLNLMVEYLGFKPIPWLAIALPIGISFYTFQTITYALDVYRRVHPPLEKLSNYILYILSFPQMIAGPIIRFNTIAGQIIHREETLDDKLIGLYRFIIGLSKKVLIANTMARQADLIFDNNLLDLSTGNAWIGILAYTLQIYFDFSGYSDMAIGLGRMMGFRFPENFNSPYTSRSISEFWRRWHITLGDFMKDYLYIPLGGNRVRKSRLYFNLGLVFLLSGLWHGASWNFVLWGGFHGAFLILDRIFLLKVLERIPRLFSTLITFFVVMMGWVVFRLESLGDIRIFYQKLFVIQGSFQRIPLEFWYISIIGLIFAFLTSFKLGRKVSNFVFNTHNFKTSQHLYMTLISLVLLVLSLSYIVATDFNPFIYFRF